MAVMGDEDVAAVVVGVISGVVASTIAVVKKSKLITRNLVWGLVV